MGEREYIDSFTCKEVCTNDKGAGTAACRVGYSIHFACADEFIIVPTETMQRFMDSVKIEKKTYIPIGDIFPERYIEYLKMVLNTNRHLPKFSYSYIEESPIQEMGIMQILVKQLKSMYVNKTYCFEKIEPVMCNGSMKGFQVIFSAEFLNHFS